MPYVGRDLQRGNYLKLDDITSSFDGSTTTFNLQSGGSAFYPGSAFSIFVVLSGLAQEPESAYTINKNTITFASAPSSVDDCFITALGVALGIGVPGHGTVNGSQLAKPFNYDGGLLYLDSTNDKIGVANTTPVVELDVNGRLDADYITGIAATFSGNVTIGGTLTYQDVSNIDSVGIITAQAGIHLGIGATSGKFLASTGITTFSSSVGIADSIFHVGNNDTSIRFPADDTFAVETAGSERLRIKSNGDVGIGLDSPTARLHVNGTTNGLQARFGGTGTGLGIECGQKTNANALVKLIAQDSTHGTFAFRTAGDERLRITSAGNIGIGTNNPDELLHISSAGITTARFRLTDRRTSLSVGTQYGVIQFEQRDSNTPGVSVEVAAVMQDTSNGNTALQFKTGTPSTITERVRITGHGHLLLGGTAGVDDLTGGAGQRGLVIGSTGMGNAGIAIINSTTGTGRIYFGDATDDNAARKRGQISYHHNDTVTSDYMSFYTAGAEALRIQSDGNFGIGTSANIRERMHLHTASSDEAYLRFTNTTTGTAAGDGFNIGINSAEQPLIWNKEYTDMLFGTHGATRMVIDKDGNVGINSATPTANYKLDVNGDLSLGEKGGVSNTFIDQKQDGDLHIINSGRTAQGASNTPGTAGVGINRFNNISGGTTLFRDFTVYNGKDSKVLVVDGSASAVGIGTDAPTQKLEVLGSTILKETSSTGTALQIKGAGTQGDNAVISFSNGYTQTFKIGMSDDIGPARDFIISETSTGASTDNENPKYTFNGNGDGIFSITDKAGGDIKVLLNSNGNSYFTGGNIGLGEDSPTYQTEIKVSVTDAYDVDALNSGQHQLRVNNAGASGVAGILLTAEPSSGSAGHAGIRVIAPANGSADMTFSTRDAGTYGERLRIKSDGKVLVGDGSAITQGRAFEVRGTGNQGVLIGSTNNNGAQLLLDGIGGGDGSGGNYSALEVPTSGHLTIRNHDADKNIILGTGSASGANDTVVITDTQRVGINATNPDYTLEVTGSFAATTKSFVIDHPTKENHKLRYACLEGPENSVYVRGRSSDPVIELPEYWVGLVHDDSITVNVTPIGNKNVWVESINNNSVTIGSDDSTEYFYTVFAERKDVEKLEVEVEN